MNNEAFKNKKIKKNYKDSREKRKERVKKAKARFDKDNESSDESPCYDGA